MNLADAHIHLFRSGPPDADGRVPPGGEDLPLYETLRREHGIDRALVVAHEGIGRHAGNNDDVLELAGTRSWIVPVAYLPAAPAPAPAVLESLADRGFRGIGLWITDDDAAAGLASWPARIRRIVAERFSVVSLNAKAELTEQILRFVRGVAPTTVLFSHLGMPGRYTLPPMSDQAAWRLSALLSLAGEEHVGVKLSGLYAVSEPRSDHPHPQAWPFVDVLFRAFGAERMYWGSDFRPATDWVPFAGTVDAYLPDYLTPEESARVMGGNLIRVVGGSRSAADAGRETLMRQRPDMTRTER